MTRDVFPVDVPLRVHPRDDVFARAREALNESGSNAMSASTKSKCVSLGVSFRNRATSAARAFGKSAIPGTIALDKNTSWP